MAGAANPNMTVNPFQQASQAQQGALATYANPSAAAMVAPAIDHCINRRALPMPRQYPAVWQNRQSWLPP